MTRDEAIKLLKTWKPQDRPLQFTEKHNPYNYGGVVRVDQKELNQDVKAPFASEAYLYNLLGKEDARTLLAIFNALTESQP